MPFQKVEFEFPDEREEEQSTEIEIEPLGEIEVDISGGSIVPEPTPEPEPEPEPEIEVVNDVPEKDRGRIPSTPPEDVTKEELNNYSEKVAKRIQHFSKGYHDERRAKETAQRERDELERAVEGVLAERNALQDTVNKNQQALFQQAKHSVEGELSQAKEAFKVAHDSGDSEALLNAQERFTNAKLKAGRLEEFEEPKEIVDTSSRTQPNRPPADPKADAWRDENTWFGNPNHAPETAFAVGLHKQLTEVDNVTVSSDEYYEIINSRMRKTFPHLYGELDEQEVQVPKPKLDNVVAPATRSTGTKKVRLTQTQLNLSKRLGLSPAEYAKQVAILEMRKQ
tara:strand:+ start:38 stop:1054 length:1017 start_codon:yes stop_codon:yes gene_type:complete